MSGWDRVDEVAEPWRERWEEAERRFFGHDLFRLEAWGSGATIQALTPGEPERREVGKIVATSLEIRVGDAKFHAVVDVRRDRHSPWPRDVLIHETEPLGSIRRGRSWDSRPCWDLVDADGDVVATVRERSRKAGAARWAVGMVVWALKTIITLGNNYDRVSDRRADFVVSRRGRVLGEIRDGGMLDLSSDPDRTLDRRLAVAAFVSILVAEEGF